MTLEGKRILLGVTASIAAYKAADLCSQLGKLGADVHVVLTPRAAQFVGAATFRAMTRNPVLTDVFDEPNARRIAHIETAQSADLVLVAPASADMLAKMAHGLADDMLSTCLLAVPPHTPLLVAPAMNSVMWAHPATASNVHALQQRGVQFVEPAFGLLACQDVGTGKLADVTEIVSAVVAALTRSLDYEGIRVVITAGATREPLDPVRFLSNRSSGKMGYALAAAAAKRGAHVTLISGFATIVAPAGVDLVRAGSAREMLQVCQAHFAECRVFIGAAAVADYEPVTVAPQKIKKPDVAADGQEEPITLRLRRTPDILAALAESKRAGQILVGFAAETENLVENARRKLCAKRLDLIVANDVTREGAGFDTDTNIVTLVRPTSADELPILPKPEVAQRVLDSIRPLIDLETENL